MMTVIAIVQGSEVHATAMLPVFTFLVYTAIAAHFFSGEFATLPGKKFLKILANFIHQKPYCLVEG